MEVKCLICGATGFRTHGELIIHMITCIKSGGKRFRGWWL